MAIIIRKNCFPSSSFQGEKRILKKEKKKNNLEERNSSNDLPTMQLKKPWVVTVDPLTTSHSNYLPLPSQSGQSVWNYSVLHEHTLSWGGGIYPGCRIASYRLCRVLVVINTVPCINISSTFIKSN